MQTLSAQSFVPIKEIRDGVVFLKNGSKRMVILTTALNFALKSEDEKEAILMQYQSFLNSLDFDLQIFVHSRKLNIQPYLDILEEKRDQQTNELLKIQIKEYANFIKTFTENNEIVNKSFFIVIPYSPKTGIQVNKSFIGDLLPFGNKKPTQTKEDNFDLIKTQLEQRRIVVQNGLKRCGLRSEVLNTEQLVELYFKIFNPGEKITPKNN